MKKSLAALFAVIMFVAIGIVPTQAIGLNQKVQFDKRDGHRHHQRKHFLDLFRLSEELGLSDAQKSEMRKLAKEERETIKPLQEQLREQKIAIHQSSEPGKFDEAKVRASASEQAKIMTEIIVARERLRAKLYNVLTPEQQQKLEQMKKDFLERRELRHQKSENL